MHALPADLQEIVKTEVYKWTQAQHEYLVYESAKAIEDFKKAGVKVFKVSPEIEKALTAEADAFYAEKSKKESPIFAEIFNSMKAFGKAYNSAN